MVITSGNMDGAMAGGCNRGVRNGLSDLEGCPARSQRRRKVSAMCMSVEEND